MADGQLTPCLTGQGSGDSNPARLRWGRVALEKKGPSAVVVIANESGSRYKELTRLGVLCGVLPAFLSDVPRSVTILVDE
jgi:hypothetical protein